MQISKIIEKYHFPPELLSLFEKKGLTNLFPTQAEAIKQGALEGKNLVMTVPTASGKTLIAELCMLNAVLNQSAGRCLYIVPLKALASEKYEDFKEKYHSFGINVGMATGDLDSTDKNLGQINILIATAEKVDSLLRSKTKWLINRLSTVIIDEIHFINDGSRGPTLEILTARIRQLNPQAQIIALSATISNAKELAGWLNSRLVRSDWRPIPLKEGVFYNGQIKFKDFGSRIVTPETFDALSDLVIDTLKSKGQVLVFVNSRRSTQSSSRQLCKSVSPLLSENERSELAILSKKILGTAAESTKICRALSESVKNGVAFHHAGLKPSQRKIVEDHFKKDLIKVICSTPTLAAGVNLPARRAIIRDVKRFESGLGSAYIPASEYKQCAGRAGRPQYDDYGEAVLMAKSSGESRELFNRYINAETEPVKSKLGQESALRIHILASIAGGYVHDVNDTFEFLSHTFFSYQKQSSSLIETISEIFDFLQSEKFIEKNGFRFYATAFGQYTSRLYIDPVSSIILREGLKKTSARPEFSATGLLHMICCCPDMPLLRYSKSIVPELEFFEQKKQDDLIFNGEDLDILEDYFYSLGILKTTMALDQWTDERKESELCDTFNIGPGDIYRLIEGAGWLLHATTIFSDLFKFKNLTLPLSQLETRVKYGVKEELLSLVQIKGIGRIRARILFKKGFKKIPDLKSVSADELAGIEKIGKSLAENIKKQISQPIDFEAVRNFAKKRSKH